jgi:hypothetical protein
MTDGATCLFCGHADRPITREHVFARWLVQKVHGARIVASPLGPHAGPVRVSRVFAAVCATCNAGWMSGLEVSLRRLVFARPRAGPIAAVDRTALSRWFTKTAALLAQAHGAELIDAAGRAALQSAMPPAIVVTLARRRRPAQRLDFILDVDGDPPVARRATIQVDDLVATIGPKGTLNGRHGTQLWPLRTHLLRWETLPVTGRLAPSVRPRAERTPASSRR